MKIKLRVGADAGSPSYLIGGYRFCVREIPIWHYKQQNQNLDDGWFSPQIRKN
jgi:hypothetical protein